MGRAKAKGGPGELTFPGTQGLAQLVKDTASAPSFDLYPSVPSASPQLSSSVFNFFCWKTFLKVLLTNGLKCQRTFWYSG